MKIIWMIPKKKRRVKNLKNQIIMKKVVKKNMILKVINKDYLMKNNDKNYNYLFIIID